MVDLPLNEDLLQYISVFENITRTRVQDCLYNDDKVVFVVARGQLGHAIGKGSERIRKMKEMFRKSVDIIEYNSDPKEFVKNIFHNYGVKNVTIEIQGNKSEACVEVDPAQKGKAIGKNGKNLKLARDLANRHHKIDSVVVA
ncbi:MAG: NusA-like transcription termination signal-binding factor, partial [Thermoplasmata archaeon]